MLLGLFLAATPFAFPERVHEKVVAEGVDTLIRRADELLADFPAEKVPCRAR